MALELRDYLLTDAGVAIAGWTVNLRTGRKTGAAGSILFSTTTDANGMWEFVDGSGGVTLVAGTKYDVQAVSGSHERWWRGYTAIPQSFTDLQIAAAAGIVLTKLDEGTADDTVDPATVPTTLDGRISQFAALLKRLSGGSTFSAAPTRGPSNSLTNGDFNHWQRGTSFAAVASGQLTADRWGWVEIGTAVATIARDTSVPTVGANAINTPYSLKMSIPATADAAIAAGDLYYIYSDVEGFDYRALTNGMALSFWVKAHRTGIYCVRVGNRGGDRSYVVEYTISAADTWEYKTAVFSTPPTAGTWGYDTALGLRLDFCLAAGSTFQTTANAWQTGNFHATSNQVNGVGATTDVFSLALVNLIPGSTAAPLVPLPYEGQLARCQRYCQVYGGDATSEHVGSGYSNTTTQALIHVPLAVPMCAIPTLTVSAAGDFVVAAASGALCTSVALTANQTSTRVAGISAGVASGLVAGQGCALLANGTANARLTLEANPA